MSENTAQRHTCFGRIFCGFPREQAERECAACAASTSSVSSTPCYHPRSCSKCDRIGSACGSHMTGTSGHERCSGTKRVAKYDDSRTYVVTGYTPENRSAYFQRNVRGSHVDAVIARAVEAKWTDVVAGPESF